MATAAAVHPAGERTGLLVARDNVLVKELPVDLADGAPGVAAAFDCEHGPFSRYRRTVEDLDDGSVRQTVDFQVATRFWGLVFVPGYRRRLLRPEGRRLWWAPPDRPDRRAAEVLGHLCTISLVAGYLGTVLTQTATYASEEFGASTTEQSRLLASVRASIVIVLVLAVLADRIGRRRLVSITATVGCVLTATGALAPNLVGLAVSQTAARGFSGALGLLIIILSAEETPSGSRAFSYSVLSMCQALGAGMCLWFLPLADIGGEGSRTWRLLYVVPLLYLPLVAIVRRNLPESRRFAAPHVEAPISGHGRRFWLLAVTLFALALFATPASQLGNEFLREVRGFSGLKITIFILATATPASIGVVLGGRMADIKGRKLVGAVAVASGTILSVIAFASAGWSLWAWSLLQNILAAATIPALGVYRAELFPTSLRGKAAGTIEIFALAGAVTGLLGVGALIDRGWSYGAAFAAIAPAPLLAAVLILVAFPETAHRSLEDINPEDRALAVAREDR